MVRAERSDGVVFTSRLSRLECRVKPLRDQDHELLRKYDDFLKHWPTNVVEIDAPTIERATDLRARYGFKTPDSIQLASAIEHRADLFLTGDAALARCGLLPVEVLDASGPGGDPQA